MEHRDQSLRFCQGVQTVTLPRVRFTVRRLMAVVGLAALVMGFAVGSQRLHRRWSRYQQDVGKYALLEEQLLRDAKLAEASAALATKYDLPDEVEIWTKFAAEARKQAAVCAKECRESESRWW